MFVKILIDQVLGWSGWTWVTCLYNIMECCQVDNGINFLFITYSIIVSFLFSTFRHFLLLADAFPSYNVQLLGRVADILLENNPELAGDRRRIVLRPPEVLHEGTKKTIFTNFMGLCRTYA